jgi:nucleoid-associated protein YgaU
MGIFDFFRDKGEDVQERETTAPDTDPADAITAMLTAVLPGQIDDLAVEMDDEGIVTLHGTAADQATYEKAILMAGNVKGVAGVRDDAFEVAEAAGTDATEAEPRFYTIEAGDSLSKIAKEVYGDAMKWQALFEANHEVIKDPDLIYPGQTIRVPDLDA